MENVNYKKIGRNLISHIKIEIDEIRNQDINALINFKNINKETILKIVFIWSIFFINIGIFVKKDMCNLFFTDIKITKYLLILYFLILIIFKSMLIIKKQKLIVFGLLFYIYIMVLGIILLKSLLQSRGWGWPFYLIIFLINANLLIIENKDFINDKRCNDTFDINNKNGINNVHNDKIVNNENKREQEIISNNINNEKIINNAQDDKIVNNEKEIEPDNMKNNNEHNE